MSIAVTVQRNDFAALADRLLRNVEAIVQKAAFDILSWAMRFVPVDTGNLKNSLNVEQVGRFVAMVLTGVLYSIYVEFGTSKMAAQPYLTPAVERVRPAFERALSQALGA